jgi:signal peptidase I
MLHKKEIFGRIYYNNMVDIIKNESSNKEDKSFNFKRSLSFILELAKIVIIAAAIVIPIRYFLFQPFFVEGQSMDPNFTNGDYLIIDEISYRFSGFERGEVVVFKYPLNVSKRLIKRVIGLPGETVEVKDGKVFVEGHVLNESVYLDPYLLTSGNVTVILGEKEYFVLGDNREFSFDSRSFGVVKQEFIIGKVFLRAWPVDSLKKFSAPAY